MSRDLLDAINQNNTKQIKQLLLDPDVNIHTNNERALRWATEYGHLDVVKFLVENGANVHTTNSMPLRLAVLGGYLDIVKFLVEHGANVHVDDNMPLRMAAIDGYFDILKFLVEHGANPEAENNRVIRGAANNGHIDIVAYLLQDPRVRDAGLPFPDPASKDPLARMLGEILMTSMHTTHRIMQTPFQKNPRLAEYELMSHILDYHPVASRKKRRIK